MHMTNLKWIKLVHRHPTRNKTRPAYDIVAIKINFAFLRDSIYFIRKPSSLVYIEGKIIYESKIKMLHKVI